MKIIKDFDLECVFLMSEILDKTDLGIDADTIIKKTKLAKLEGAKDAGKLGKEIVVGIGVEMGSKMLRNIYKAKKEVKQLISELSGESIESVNKMNLKDIKEFFGERKFFPYFAHF